MRRFFLWCGGLFLAISGQSWAGEDWQVEEAFGPTKKVQFETDEGTWMNLDVSPDGKEIVFDMLGDIYVVGIEGGKASALTRGLAMDVQPRFSPDGKSISFTSDRGGGDNIWIMDRKGENLVQVTKESFRLLNNAAWTPDSQYLIARKHFTSRRSLGAGELWMYHRSGGSGIRLNERKNDQQDLGEPSVSPDGRYVYFSEDVSPGGAFDYNRDPHSGIYAVRRLDLENGGIETVISGTGGAARPQVSPSGKSLAFIRRIGIKTVLHIANLETGALRQVYSEMGHDQQEAWAIFGVYPGFAWTPDGQGLVFWAKGKINHLNLSTGESRIVPFQAQVDSEVIEPARMVPDLQRTRALMIRDAATSPDGRWLVFHGLGSLWKKKLPNGKPVRLTSDDAFEYQPSFSPDGKSLVYTSWRDDRQSRIHVIGLDGQNAKTLSTGPGFYSDPSFLPDGSGVVYRRGGGNRLLGNLNQNEPGLYRIGLEAEKPVKVIEHGREPFVLPSDGRLYYLDGWGQRKTYNSVSLDGTDHRHHLDLSYVTELKPSPDGRWMAFREGFQVYIAAWPQTGKAFSLSKNTKAVPVRHLSRDVGTAMHWSADSKKLHWLEGEHYHTHVLEEPPFKKDEGAAPEGVAVGLEFEHDKPGAVTVLKGARIITMRGDEVIGNGTLVIDKNRIAAVGKTDEVTIPAGAVVLDLHGKTIIPGMIDIHGHASHFSSGPSPQTNWVYYANLAFGITALHDPSANTTTVFSQSELVRAGKMVGPRIFSTGAVLYGADGDGRVVIDTLDDAQTHLRRLKGYGAFSVKSYNQPRRDQKQMILSAARDEKILVVNEGGSTYFHNLTMLLDGSNAIEHNIPVAPLYRDVIQLWAATDVRYTPTLVVCFGGISGEYYWYQHDNVWEHPRLGNFFPPGDLERRSRRRLKLPEDEFYHIEVARSAKKLLDQGVKVQVGGHGQLQGLAPHWEMWMLVQGGFTPMEGLRAATLHGADYLGLSAELGSLEKGKLADLVVLDANPLADIRNSDKVHAVMVNGRIYDGNTMNEIGATPKQRPAFFWEREGYQAIGFGTEPEGETHLQCACRPGSH